MRAAYGSAGLQACPGPRGQPRRAALP